MAKKNQLKVMLERGSKPNEHTRIQRVKTVTETKEENFSLAEKVAEEANIKATITSRESEIKTLKARLTDVQADIAEARRKLRIK